MDKTKKSDSRAENERRTEINFLQILVQRYPEKAKRFVEKLSNKNPAKTIN